MCALLENVLETVTIDRHPQILKIKQFMKEHGAINALMSGSGPTVLEFFRMNGRHAVPVKSFGD